MRSRRSGSAFAVVIVVVITIIPAGATAAGRPTGPLSPVSGAWFGGSVNQIRNDGVNGGQAEIAARETFLGRTYDVMDRFYGWSQAVPTSLESWDVSMGRIPMVTWGAFDTLQLKSGSQDAWLRAQADRFAALGSPIFLRFFHEMDGGYRQSIVHSPQDFIDAWRHVHDIFVQEGATNVVWIWCPTAWSFVTRSPWPPNYYPGDTYVDWIATDGYSWYPITGGWRTWTQIFQPFYDWASTMSKPIMIAENGVLEDPAVPGRKAAWIADSQSVLKNRYPLIQAVLYFDIYGSLNGTTLNWPVDTSQSSYDAYKAMGADPYFNQPHGPPDTTPPTQPGKPSGTSSSSSSIDLTWDASSDDASTSLAYQVKRDGAQIASLTSSSTTTVSFSDTGVAPSSTHTYTVIALDGANNPSAESPTSDTITVQDAAPPTSIFADDFSSGGFSNWTGVTRLTIDGTQGGVAPPSARAQVSNLPAWAYEMLPGTYGSLCMSEWVNASSLGGNRVILRLRTAANGPVSRVWANAAGTLWVKSDVSGTQISSGTSLGSGWHTIELCGTVGNAGTWSLYRDGVQIVSNWVANTGTTPIGRVEIGDTAAGTFTLNFDDVVVDQTPG